jgi:mannose/fructose-specific phosphotransferase system component IIA
MVRVLLVTHGDLGDELLNTAELVVGPQDGARVLSNRELSSESLADAIRTELAAYGSDQAVIFVDVAGGSCLCACRITEEQRDRFRVISGVNLPMVLEFFHYRNRLPFKELVDRVAARGKAGIQVI